MEVPMPSTVSGLCTSTDWVFQGTMQRQKNGSGRLRRRGMQLQGMRLRQCKGKVKYSNVLKQPRWSMGCIWNHRVALGT